MKSILTAFVGILCFASQAANVAHGNIERISNIQIEGRNYSLHTENSNDVDGNSVVNIFNKNGSGWKFVNFDSGAQARILAIAFERPVYITEISFSTCGNEASDRARQFRAALQGLIPSPVGLSFHVSEYDEKLATYRIRFKNVYDVFLKTKSIYLDQIGLFDSGCLSNLSILTSDVVEYRPFRSWPRVFTKLLNSGASVNSLWEAVLFDDSFGLDLYKDLIYYAMHGNQDALHLLSNLRQKNPHISDEHRDYFLKNFNKDLDGVANLDCGRSDDANGCKNLYFSEYGWSVSVSSYLDSQDHRFSVKGMFDGDIMTSWCSAYNDKKPEMLFTDLNWDGVKLIHAGIAISQVEHRNDLIDFDLYAANQSDFIGDVGWIYLGSIEVDGARSVVVDNILNVAKNKSGIDVFAVKVVARATRIHGNICIAELSISRAVPSKPPMH